MKKWIAILCVCACTLALGACKGGGENAEASSIKDAKELLTTVWSSYGEDEKFPASGGDSSEENMSMEGPGKFGIEDGAMLDSILGYPKACVDQIDDAASLMHMMNANTFTCGAYHAKEGTDMKALTQTMKENILSRQWMCGFPELLVIATVDNYVVSFFGNEDMVGTFKEKLTAAYPQTQVAVEEPIM